MSVGMKEHYFRQQNRLLVQLLVLVVSSCWFAGAASAQANQKRLDMFVGEQTVLSADNVDKFSLGTTGVVAVRLPEDGKEFVLVGLAPGDTTLLLIMKSGAKVRYNIVVREVRVTERDNIRLDFYFVELSRDEGYRIGVGWPGTIGGTVGISSTISLKAPRAVTEATATIATQVLPRLDMAQNSGWAKVLREATIIMANGEESVFESGGELNFRIESAVASSIQQISFGSRIQVKPRYDRTTGRLDLKINALVSELTDAGSDGLPGRTFTSLDTLVNLELGQSIVLAGIHAQSIGRGKEGLPLLSQIPVLGYLFGTGTFRETEVENLIFIVPTVVQAVDLQNKDRVQEAQEAYRVNEGEVDGEILYNKAFPRPRVKPKDSKHRKKRERGSQ